MNPEKARPWLVKAARDWSVIQACLQHRLPFGESPLWDAICFHAQQVAEKSLKGLITSHEATVRRTHNLMELLDECIALDSRLEALREACLTLADYSTVVRYPSDLPEHEPDEADAKEAVEAARRIRELIQLLLHI